MEIHVGNTYRITDDNDDVTTFIIKRKDDDNWFTCKVLASTYYDEDDMLSFTESDLIRYNIVFIRGNRPPMEKIDTIKMNPILREQYINMALDTGDENWFLELTSCKDGVC